MILLRNKTLMVCNVISIVLLIAFVIKVIIDYTKYTAALNSAPFYVWVLVDALFFVLPAIIVFAVGIITKKKQ